MIPLLSLLALALAAPEPSTLAFEHYELANGLDVILAPDPGAPVAHVNVWYHVGSADEAEGLSVFAHLFEHLMFQGSPSSPDEYFAPLESVGATINGTTNVDRTNYFESVPPEHLPRALFLESDRMGWLLDTLDQERLDNQRDVVRNERRQRYEDRPYGTVWIDLMGAMYPPGHPYHHPTIGSHADLERASLDDVRAFFRTWYGPDHASLVVAGNFEPAVAKDLIERYFGSIPAAGPAARRGAAPVRLRETVEVRQVQDVPQPQLWMAWHAPPAYAPDEAALVLLADVLSGGRESRLDQALVHQGDLATSVSAEVWSARLGSQLLITVTPAPGRTTSEVVTVVDRVLRELTTSAPPTVEEIEAARAAVERRQYTALTRVGSKADLLNRYAMYLGTPDGLQQDLARYADLDPDELGQAARRWLTRPRVELHITPHSEVADASEPWRRLRSEPLPRVARGPEPDGGQDGGEDEGEAPPEAPETQAEAR